MCEAGVYQANQQLLFFFDERKMYSTEKNGQHDLYFCKREKWGQNLLELGNGDKNTLAWYMQWILLKLYVSSIFYILLLKHNTKTCTT